MIGHVLRERRRGLDLTLETVARAVGVTKGFLSDIERDKASPSVMSLVRLCEVLALPVGSLFNSNKSQVVRAHERAPIRFGGEALKDFLLTPSGSSGLMVLWTELEPAGNGGAELYALPSEDSFALVLSGSIDLVFASEIFKLRTGDSMTWKSRTPHTFRNASDRKSAVVVFVMTPAPR